MPCYITSWRAWSLGDVIAGVTVAATSLPQYIAYAELAGLAGHRGLRSSGPPLIVFAFVTGSPCLCIGVTSVTSLMAFQDLRGAEYKETFGEEAWVDLLSAYAVLVGMASLALAASGAAKIASHIPGPVKSGWKLGFALSVVSAQAAGAVFTAGSITLKKSCALPLFPGSTEQLSGGLAATYRLGWLLLHPLEWNPVVTSFAAMTFLIVLCGKEALQRALRLPGVEVLVATSVGAVLTLMLSYPGEVVGIPPPSPGGNDPLALARNCIRRWPWELPLGAAADRLGGWPLAILKAVAFASVDFLATISVEAEKPPPGGWNPTWELVGQGVGCMTSGACGSAPIGGSLSRSMVAGMTGANSPLMGLFCGISTLLLALPQLAALLAPTPKSVLAAVVLAAVLPSVVRPKDVLRLHGSAAAVGWTTAIFCLLLDPTKGFGMGLVLHFAISALRSLPHVLSGKEGKTE